MKTTIHIPEPCHENWDKMTPVEKGRFCKVCSKEVVDFTNKKREEIISILENTSGNTCGRFLNTHVETGRLKKKKKPGVISRVKIGLMIFIGFLFASKNTKAQGQVSLVKGKPKIQKDENIFGNKMLTISGTIYEKDSVTPAKFAQIRIYSEEKYLAFIRAKDDGSYSFNVSAEDLNKNNVFISVNYEKGWKESTESLDTIITKQNTVIDFFMETPYQYIGKVMIVRTENREEIPLVSEEIENNPNDSSLITDEMPLKNESPEKNTIKITASPNPSDGNYLIETGMHIPINIHIASMEGKIISTKTHVLNKTKIDISAYAPGIYFLIATDPKSGQKLSSVKLVKGE
ncbi:MAG: T9SS type A sorting domain-containing protein [Bacteroidota bacterium]